MTIEMTTTTQATTGELFADRKLRRPDPKPAVRSAKDPLTHDGKFIERFENLNNRVDVLYSLVQVLTPEEIEAVKRWIAARG